MPGGSPVSCRWTTCCGWPATSWARSPEPGAARGTTGSPIEPQPTQDRAGTIIPQAVEAGLQEAGDLVVARLDHRRIPSALGAGVGPVERVEELDGHLGGQRRRGEH